METKHGYKKAQMGYSHNMSDYSAEVGENVMNHVGSSEGARPLGKMAAGVMDGLASAESASDVKNIEQVSSNERPVARRTSAGKPFTIGV